MKLNTNIARCEGSQCTRKLECARHLALSEELPEGSRYSVGDNFCMADVGHGKIAWHWSYIILEGENV